MGSSIELGKKSNVFLIILFLMVGFGNVYYNISRCRTFHNLAVIMGFIPLLVVLIRIIISIKGSNANYKIINPLVLTILIVFSILGYGYSLIADKASNTEDIKSYKKVLKINNYPNNEINCFFPDSVPTDASDAKMKEWGTFGNQKAGMYLSYKYNEDDDIKKILAKYEDKCEYVFSNKMDIDEVYETINVPDIVKEEIIKDGDFYDVYMIKATRAEEYENIVSRGIAVNTTEKKVLYFSYNS